MGGKEIDNHSHTPPRAVLDRGRSPHKDSGNPLVAILAKLTADVERFDSNIDLHRKSLEAGPDPAAAFQLRSHSEQVGLDAAEIVACAQQALDQLHRLAEPSAGPSLPANGS